MKLYFCYACGEDFDTWTRCKKHLLECSSVGLIIDSSATLSSSDSAAVHYSLGAQFSGQDDIRQKDGSGISGSGAWCL